MKITSKVHCGIVVVIEMAISQGENGIKPKELTERLCITPKFLESILNDLKRAGIVAKTSGNRNAGFKLTKPPEEINGYMVYRAFEPELSVYRCVINGDICQRSSFCGSHYFLGVINDEMKMKMESISIRDLINHQNISV